MQLGIFGGFTRRCVITCLAHIFALCAMESKRIIIFFNKINNKKAHIINMDFCLIITILRVK